MLLGMQNHSLYINLKFSLLKGYSHDDKWNYELRNKPPIDNWFWLLSQTIHIPLHYQS